MYQSATESSHWPEIEKVLRRHGLHKHNTIRAYRRASQLLDGLAPTTMTQADFDAVYGRVRAKGSGNGPRLQLTLLKAILRRVYGRHDLIMKIPTYRSRVKDVLDVADVRRLAQSFQGSALHEALFQTQYGAALRPSEVVGLDVVDVDLAMLEVHVRDSKTGDRVSNLSERAVASLRAWLTVRAGLPVLDRALFVDATGTRLTKSRWSRELKRAAVVAGISRRVYPHMLRASSITHLLNAGVNPAVVQRQAGHANLQTTWIYNRPTRRDQRELLSRAWKKLEETASPATILSAPEAKGNAVSFY